MKTLGAILYENFELLDLYGPLEMFGNIGPDFQIVTVSEQQGAIKSAQGPSTVAEFEFTDHPDLNYVLVPGGLGTFTQLNNPLILDFIRKVSATAEILMSVCSGSALFAKAGILDGKRATSNKMFFNFTAEQSGKVKWVENARWVEDDNIFTSSGVSAGIDMALSVVSKIYGHDRAEKISIMTEYEWQTDPSIDPFAKYLNKGDIAEFLSIYSER
jgi:transcriptional regulator GlxA family with amidase domain